jgi:hypothetical protein
MKKAAIRVLAGWAGIWLCVILGPLLLAPVALLVPSLGHGGRDLRPRAWAVAALICFWAVVASRRYGWRLRDGLATLLVEQATVFLMISWFVGHVWQELLDPFTLSWFLFPSPFIGLPWCLGFGMGYIWRQLKAEDRARPSNKRLQPTARGEIMSAPRLKRRR